MNRNPPVKVKRILREEVGFGCPVPGCGQPYLEWHHFDPPWHQANHHNPDGMIALCRMHHLQADQGAFTADQLREMKRCGKENWKQVSGKFNWMRNRLLAVVGGNFYYETPVIFQFKEKPVIWFERDEKGYFLLNLNMLSTGSEPRAYIRNNEWFNVGGEEDIECPPSAKRLKIQYPNGDLVAIEFFELNRLEEAEQRYPGAGVERWPIELPITAVEVTNVVADSGLEFNARETRFGVGNTMKNCFLSHCRAGLVIG
ncbi:HNH endonuclease signature motif containing protein [Thiomicrorhabdus sp.]|uniref:HNH endonuclease signature motif containing protein n=1 Tax=Thiomicrorhabdus sp. TaxID=2039724 RepID=UPI0029C74950|nr:HNH endonuclease signature motif containing protein [Thiomicrorhabdus sp.]